MKFRTFMKSQNISLRALFLQFCHFLIVCPILLIMLGSVGMKVYLFFSGRPLKIAGSAHKTASVGLAEKHIFSSPEPKAHKVSL